MNQAIGSGLLIENRKLKIEDWQLLGARVQAMTNTYFAICNFQCRSERSFFLARSRAAAVVALLALSLSWAAVSLQAASSEVPGESWEMRSPSQVGLSTNKLEELATLVGGRGCVVRDGYMSFAWGDQATSGDWASAFKPVLSTLMLMAVQEGLLKSPDDRVSAVEPRLENLNGGKDAGITWRHLASQTSGYGLPEPPGAAYSYNDYAIALYFDSLMNGVFRTNSEVVLRTRLAAPLQFEDRYTFNALGLTNRTGRLAMSCRDFARFGLLYLRGGRWGDRQLVQSDLIRLAIGSPLPATTPRTSGLATPMLPSQRSLGGNRNITPVGPGLYSFNWWLNRTNAKGQILLGEASSDVYLASGHGGMRVLYIVPSDNLIVCWNDSGIQDQDSSLANPDTRMNHAARLIREMVLRQ